MNRVIEIECGGDPLFENPVKVADTVKQNYGFAGRMFVEKLQDGENMDFARTLQKKYAKELSGKEITDKQSISASLILAADTLATKWIFQDERALTASDIRPFLFTRSQVSVGERAFQYILETISMNKNRFKNNDFDSVWGEVDEKHIYFIKTQFDKVLSEGGYNSRSVLSWLARNGKIEIAPGRTTKSKRINGNVCHCVWLNRMNDEGLYETGEDEENPFQVTM